MTIYITKENKVLTGNQLFKAITIPLGGYFVMPSSTGCKVPPIIEYSETGNIFILREEGKNLLDRLEKYFKTNPQLQLKIVYE